MHQPRENPAPDLAAAPWARIQAHLEHAKRQVYAQIESYPSPITGCDQQFDRLMEQRDALSRELARLAAARDAAGSGPAAAAAAEAFLATSPVIDAEARRALEE